MGRSIIKTPRWGGLSRAALSALLGALLAACALGPSEVATPREPAPPAASAVVPLLAPDAVRSALAPTGRLRVAVYPGSPTSLVREAPPEQMRGLSVEIGREMARRLGVQAEIVVHARVAEIIDALKAGRVDVTITNATPARAAEVDFTPPLVALELGVLVLPGSPVADVAGIDQTGVRIGVSQGSSSQAALSRSLRLASLVPAASLQQAREQLQARSSDAFATNKGILFEMADQLPGARVLAGRWGLEQLAIAVPQGRTTAAVWLRDFAAEVRASGLVQQAAQRAGLRGLAGE
jgi:polar amino acid transport system substrate-binding protein